jgi:endonuclease/exonuclease/phosphatase (EEP) superfamily protein YafD
VTLDGARSAWLGLSLVCLAACSLDRNFLDPDGPRYWGDFATSEPTPGDSFRVVSYNLAFGREVEIAIAALRDGPLAGADVVLMQEMDPVGVEDIAEALEWRYRYYPGSVKKGKRWGNAVLTPWPIVEDHKVLLPHADPYANTRRIAVAAELDVAGRSLRVYSTHIGTPFLGLGARLDQMEEILDDAGDGGPTVIGGDLNTADPGSTGQTLELFAEHGYEWASHDATDTGSSFGLYDTTLDYVFARDMVALASGTYRGEDGSDHRPIWVELEPP